MSDSQEGSDVERASELLFKEKVEVISNDVLSSRLSEVKKIVIAFISGLSLLVGAGLIWKENILLPVIEYIYPAEYLYPKIINKSLDDEDVSHDIYVDMKARFLNDDKFVQMLISDEQKKAVISYIKTDEPEDIRLRHLPSVDSDVFDKIRSTIETDEVLKKRIWTVLESGDKTEFNRLIKSNFGDALVDEFYEEMTFVYETLPNRNRDKFEKEIVKKGNMLLPVEVKTIGSRHEGNPDSCGIRVSHTKLQAVVVIPQNATERMYRWFKCPGTEFPHLFVKLKINGLTLDEEIEVIGVSRDGKGKNVELRVTQLVGKRFNLPGWEKYESNTSGYFNVTRASF